MFIFIIIALRFGDACGIERPMIMVGSQPYIKHDILYNTCVCAPFFPSEIGSGIFHVLFV